LLVTPPAARGGTQPDAPGNAATEVEFVDGLGEHGDRLALQPADGVAISYRGLDQRLAEVADRLGRCAGWCCWPLRTMSTRSSPT
jgi:hypothetical protein